MSKKYDLRITKTYNALIRAMFTLLNRRNFNELTINDLCTEALISRAAFYTHFNDKYDFLKYFLAETGKIVMKDVYKYEELENEINQFIYLNKKMIKNIFKDANSETLMIMHEFMSSIVELMIKRETKNQGSPNQIILSNFFVGGLVNHLIWMIENNFPPEITMMNTYLYRMLETLTIWDAKQELNKTVE